MLSAKRVGPTGRVYGLDMTDEMLALARENQRKGQSVDVIISNCVINLSPDWPAGQRPTIPLWACVIAARATRPAS
jgi:hypothetical protein